MRNKYYGLLALTGAMLASSASAAITFVGNIDLRDGAYTFAPTATDSFVFSYNPEGSFDFDPTFVQTTGSAQTTAFGGFLGIPLAPSTFFTDPAVTIGPNTFPGFASFPTATAIPFSIAAGDLGLRYAVGDDFFYGYARVTGPNVSIGFQTVAGVPIQAGAVPEPATWAMMIGGFGLVGAALRRRSTKVVFA